LRRLQRKSSGNQAGAVIGSHHVHNNWPGTRNSVNVGADVWEFRPVCLSEIEQRARSLPVNQYWDEVEPGCDLWNVRCGRPEHIIQQSDKEPWARATSSFQGQSAVAKATGANRNAVLRISNDLAMADTVFLRRDTSPSLKAMQIPQSGPQVLMSDSVR